MTEFWNREVQRQWVVNYPSGFGVKDGHLCNGPERIADIADLDGPMLTWLVDEDMVEVDELVADIVNRCVARVLDATEGMSRRDVTKHLIDAASTFLANAREGSI